MKKTFFSFFVCGLLVLLATQTSASGFGDFEGGLLRIEQPRKVLIYKGNSTSTSCAISIGSTEYVGISDAHWEGPLLAISLVEKDGDNVIRIYSSTTTFKTVH